MIESSGRQYSLEYLITQARSR